MMGAKHLTRTKERSHVIKQRSPDEIRAHGINQVSVDMVLIYDMDKDGISFTGCWKACEKLLLLLLHMALTRGLIALESKTFSSLTLVVVLFTIKDKVFQDKATAGNTHLRGKDIESHDMLRQGFTHVFLMTFNGKDEFNAFQTQPNHFEFTGVFSPVIENIVVLDFPYNLVKAPE
ncbi:Stress-response A/B barrel domain-containing protein [Glycine soja]|uniref:Stress-response A/B barrel domain-containing protein n=1 Tax=Glycine soja TaxID=3848 RepID=A0A445LRL9_GLYSO|nr:Stress-response A/B barrel domain-containing protein [Glycine soja]